jgi:hypothetical protein
LSARPSPEKQRGIFSLGEKEILDRIDSEKKAIFFIDEKISEMII